ncbi:nitrate reductase molybdenum cofactor assembly chaperone [Glycomyces albidus]|uniref:Nitrate reductase molybdenum cofactor assembly chaperone n=1 Tax=Glycomyces albidus TaxID=2656774 RepID=A0A6L5G284_9ACTN|nr:nitrate reductase molybdenum cofactor assembly chaperone [Glycomyces albidus]
MLLTYPDQRFYDRLPLVAAAAAELGTAAGRALASCCDHAARTPALRLGAEYVETFDLKRKRSLHLTYYTDGDTRRRGHALASIKEVYRACGWTLDAAELPDHLAVVLEFSARGDAAQGERLLVRFQPGIELLWAALGERGSPYAAVLDAVAATLPPPDEARREAARLAAAGPPTEDVGLDPYGKPRSGAVLLGMPAKAGAGR